MRKPFLLVSVIVILCLACAAQAATVSYTQAVPLSLTNWNNILTFQQFDPSLGVLNSVTFIMTSNCQGQGFAENDSTLSGSPFNWELSALVQLKRPDNTVLLQVQPYVASPVYNLGVYDGALDFAGTSGITDPMSCSQTVSLTTPPPVTDLALFTGPGTINLTATATALSKVYGGGNITMGSRTMAGVEATVIYDYTVPEPAGIIAILTGIVGITAYRRRR